jgi:multiple sugar transport system permease protein
MNRAARVASKTVWLIIMSILTFVMIYPFLFSFLAGMNSKTEFANMGAALLPIPQNPVLSNFAYILTPSGIRPFLNTVFRTLWYTVLVSVMAILFGYVMARYEFKAKKLFLGIIVCTQLVPGALTLIPSFVMVARLPFLGGNNWMGMGGRGLINNPAILYLQFGWGYLLWVFLFMQSMKTFPRGLEEAAEIEGCGFWRIIFTIVIPLQLPIIAVIAVNVALGTWNDWLAPFMYINRVQDSTLPAYIATMNAALQSFGDKDYPKLFAMSTMAILPPFFIFLFLQRYIIQGIASAGIKG